MEEGLTIQEAAERVGLSIDTLRYYERAGLAPHVVRTSGGQRRYDRTNLAQMRFVTRMRQTGMPIRRIREYLEATIGEDGSAPERRAILVEHRRSVIEKISTLQEALDLIEHKITLYDSDKMCSPESDATPDSTREPASK